MTVVEWAETNWILPETRRPIVLQPWQRETLLAIFPPDGSPSPHETFLISTVKKAGKTELNAVATLYAALTFPAPETVFAVANDLEQAQERVFERIAKASRAMGLVRRGAAVVSKSEIVFPETGSRIVAVGGEVTFMHLESRIVVGRRHPIGKRMSLEEIAEKLNGEKVPTIHGTNTWTAASVRKAFVS